VVELELELELDDVVLVVELNSQPTTLIQTIFQILPSRAQTSSPIPKPELANGGKLGSTKDTG
jgi:hypothetical protein